MSIFERYGTTASPIRLRIDVTEWSFSAFKRNFEAALSRFYDEAILTISKRYFTMSLCPEGTVCQHMLRLDSPLFGDRDIHPIQNFL